MSSIFLGYAKLMQYFKTFGGRTEMCNLNYVFNKSHEFVNKRILFKHQPIMLKNKTVQ